MIIASAFTIVSYSHSSTPGHPTSEIHISFKSVLFGFCSTNKETNGGRNFETVKHGSRTLENLADRGPQLDLGNKFDALRRS